MIWASLPGLIYFWGERERKMKTEALRTLIELFNKSLVRAEWGGKQYLEIVRTEGQEILTFEQRKTRAQDFALWLIPAEDIRIKDKIAIHPCVLSRLNSWKD